MCAYECIFKFFNFFLTGVSQRSDSLVVVATDCYHSNDLPEHISDVPCEERHIHHKQRVGVQRREALAAKVNKQDWFDKQGATRRPHTRPP